MTNGKIILIKEGQLITGRKALSAATGIPESTIEDILRLFESEQQIRQQKTTKYRLITILNWKEYQESDNKATTKQQQADTNKNVKNEKNTGVATAPQVYEITEGNTDTERPKKESRAKYPHSKEVFSWFPKPQKSWEALKNVQEREYAEFLYARGEKNVRGALQYCADNEDNEYFPKVVKPSDLEKKWMDIVAYRKKHG